MSDSGRASRQDAFLQVYRVVRRVMDSATLLAEQLESDPAAQDAFSAERAGADYVYQDLSWDHVLPFVAELKQSLQDDLIQALRGEAVAEIECAIHHAEEAIPPPGELGGNPRVLAEVVDHLEQAVQDLNEVCYRRAISAFGVWGAIGSVSRPARNSV